jgi:cytochrome bd-type quinol oxidase subunit 1
VFLAQFAIGAGWLLCYFQWLAQTGRCPVARKFVDGYFRVLILVSFVLGALTGVAMWFTSIQISPRTIGLMVDEFHWIWATEWTFFCLEVVAGYLFYRYGERLPDRSRFRLLLLYAVAAWASLFWINGILSWQLTPGNWTESGSLWSGFFNPTFWPSLFYRTVVCMTLAALAACLLVNLTGRFDREEKSVIIGKAGHFLMPMLLMPLLGLWYFAAMPADSRSWVTGGSVAMTMFMTLGVSASLLIGLYAVVGIAGLRMYINAATALMLLALALAATAGGEFVREGVRKPYTIRNTLYSNSIRQDELEWFRENGIADADPYPLLDDARYVNDQLRLGAKVFRFQCSVCHTLDGVNGLTDLTGAWSAEQKRLMIAQLQHTKTFMPPFAGTAEELEALVQLLTWQHDGQPADWQVSAHPAVLQRLQEYLTNAGTQPSVPEATPEVSQRSSDRRAR